MGRKRILIYDLKREYDSSNNPERERIINNALDQLKALPKL